MKKDTLESLLKYWTVVPIGQSTEGLSGWYAVCRDYEVVAYFQTEKDALRFRFAEINRILNG